MSRGPNPERRFVVTVDDPGGLIQDVHMLERAVGFFDRERVPASFFVVPCGEGGWQVDREQAWLAVARAAQGQGHDCQLHGLAHADHEFGPNPAFVSAMNGADPAERLRAAKEECGHQWRRDVFVDRLTRAVGLFESAFGRRPLVLRTGALSQTPALYDAVADVGIRYVSNRVVDPRGWAYIAGRYDAPGDWDPGVPPMPYRLTEHVVDLPMASEYAWRLTPDTIDRHLALAVEDLGRVFAADGVFILICHVQEVGAEEPYARRLVHQLLETAKHDYGATFQTLARLVGDIEQGEVGVVDYDAHRTTSGGYHDGH